MYRSSHASYGISLRIWIYGLEMSQLFGGCCGRNRLDFSESLTLDILTCSKEFVGTFFSWRKFKGHILFQRLHVYDSLWNFEVVFLLYIIELPNHQKIDQMIFSWPFVGTGYRSSQWHQIFRFIFLMCQIFWSKSLPKKQKTSINPQKTGSEAGICLFIHESSSTSDWILPGL